MPRELKRRLADEVEATGRSVNDVAVGYLAASFAVDFEPSGRAGRPPREGGSVLLRMPPELKERILAEAAAERPNVVSLPQRRSWTAPLAAAAAIAAAVAIGVGVYAATRPASTDPLASVLAQPGAKLVPMGDRGALAVAPDGTAAIALTVPRAPAGKTYEAWVIRDGAAQRAGLFSGATVLRIDRPVKPGSVVAVTLERAGGVDAPTSKPLAATKEVS